MVARIVGELVGSAWVGPDGVTHPIALGDILIVAPYNAQVGRLRAALPGGARVGTVDKFQGQEAPVALYSMASSSVEDAPRGVSFLYDLHRLNVAISRARCVAIVIGSPALLDAAVNTPDQLRYDVCLALATAPGTTARARRRLHWLAQRQHVALRPRRLRRDAWAAAFGEEVPPSQARECRLPGSCHNGAPLSGSKCTNCIQKAM